MQQRITTPHTCWKEGSICNEGSEAIAAEELIIEITEGYVLGLSFGSHPRAIAHNVNE